MMLFVNEEKSKDSSHWFSFIVSTQLANAYKDPESSLGWFREHLEAFAPYSEGARKLLKVIEEW